MTSTAEIDSNPKEVQNAVGQDILKLENLSKSFKNDLFKKTKTALTKFSCSFQTGRCTGLLGHNGAGKTTTIRLILGIIFPDDGQILFEGKPLTDEAKADIGYMAETNKLPANLSPLELLRSQLQLCSNTVSGTPTDMNEIIAKTLQEVGLWEHRSTKVKHLSKGLGRRLAWAIASIHRPKLLILDEPFSGLDPLGRKLMQSWIEELKESGTSIILCTHELWSAQTLCDDLYILRKGELVYSSLNPSSHTGGYEATGKYIIHVSGTSEDSLTALKTEYNLNPWQGLAQEGWSSKLVFSEYVDASAWLSACIKKGYLIINFISDGGSSETYLLQFFEDGN